MSDRLPGVRSFPLERGLHPGVDALEYHQWPGASQSRLKILRDQSPAHLRWSMDHREEPTDAMRLGAAFHTCVLEPARFPALYLRAPEGDGRTKAVKDALAALQLQHPAATFLKPREYDTCLAMRDAVAAHPSARVLLDGEHEASAVWADPETGVLCRGRFDAVGRGIGAITDLKSAADASPHRFPLAAYKLGYHIQASHYLSGASALGIEADSFGMVVVEKEPPYAVAVYQIHAAALHDGDRERRALLDTWAVCESSGTWPGYATEIVILDLPKWAPGQITERVGDL